MENLLSRRDIAEIIGKSPTYVGQYVRRGELIEVNKKIDISTEKSRMFLAKFTKKEEAEPATAELSKDKGKITPNNIDFIKKQFEIKKIQADLGLKKLETEKKKSKVVPLDFIVDWVTRAMKGTFSQTINFANTQIETICNDNDIESSKKLDYKKKFKMGLNEIIAKSIKEQLPEALEAAKEYALQSKW